MWNNRAMSNRYWVSVAAIAVAAAFAGVYVARMLNQPAVPSLESGTSLPQARVLPDFNLVDTQGAPAPTGQGLELFGAPEPLVLLGARGIRADQPHVQHGAMLAAAPDGRGPGGSRPQPPVARRATAKSAF